MLKEEQKAILEIIMKQKAPLKVKKDYKHLTCQYKKYEEQPGEFKYAKEKETTR